MWRVVKLAEEVVVEAYEENTQAIEHLKEKMEDLKKENAMLRGRLGDDNV